MVHDLPGGNCARSTGLVADWSSLGYSERASSLLGGACFGNESMVRESQDDFFQAIQILGAESAVPPRRATNQGLRFIPVCVSCPLDTWTAVFGRIEPLIRCHKAPMRLAVQVWERRCTDGTAACVGHVYERSAGVLWVVLVRLLFF